MTIDDQPDGRPLIRLANSSPTVRPEVVLPRRLDRYGIKLAAICPEGGHRVRLLFLEGPVEALDDVTRGCWCHSPAAATARTSVSGSETTATHAGMDLSSTSGA